MPLCACGCGEMVDGEYAHGHKNDSIESFVKPPPLPQSQSQLGALEFLSQERASLKEALLNHGVDANFVAEKLMQLSQAETRRWNKVLKKWDTYPDNRTRDAALDKIVKIMGGYSKQEANVNLNINANLESILRSTDDPFEVQQKIKGFVDDAIDIEIIKDDPV